MTSFIRGMTTSTFTGDVGIGGLITTVRGCLPPGDIPRQFCTGTALTKSAIIAEQSTDDMSMTEHTIMDDSTVRNSVAGIQERGRKKEVKAIGDKNTKRGYRSGCPR